MPRRLSGLFLTSILSMVLVAACDTKPLTPLPVDSSKQETLDGKRLQRLPMVIVVAVDDAATTEAAQLRARIAQSVRAGLLSELNERWTSCGNADPAAWHPGDIRVILARPSAPDGAALLTPLEIPSLAWITKRSTKEEIEIVATSTAEALEKRLAGAGEAYRPLRAAKRALELVTRTRAPESDEEAAFVASLPEKVLAKAIIGGARDDEDSTSVEALALTPDTEASAAVTSIAVVGPFTSSNGGCEVDAKGTSRLEAWGRGASAHLIALPCDANPALDQLLSFCCADCSITCHARPLAVAADGTTDCRIFVDQTDLESCHPERGHRDPDGKPELVDRQGTTLRRCEVDQLTGAALQACRSSFDCPDCPSGFCATEVPELSHAQECKQGEHDWPLRFTGEALDAPGDWIHLVCNTGPTDG